MIYWSDAAGLLANRAQLGVISQERAPRNSITTRITWSVEETRWKDRHQLRWQPAFINRVMFSLSYLFYL